MIRNLIIIANLLLISLLEPPSITKYSIWNINSDNNLVIPEYKIDLLNKNKKVLQKIESIQEIELKSSNNSFKRNKFNSNNFKRKYNKKSKFKKHYNFRSKIEKNNFDNKKLVT